MKANIEKLDELAMRWYKICQLSNINPLFDDGFSFTDWLRGNNIDIESVVVTPARAKREFFVDTPLGKLKVWAKHETDTPEDFPGVYVDLARKGKADDLLSCIEYDSCNDRLQTCVYQPGHDEPCELVIHELDEGEDIEPVPENALGTDSDGLSEYIVSMAVDGRLDVRVRANSFAEAFAKAESAFADADISQMEVVGVKPVNN